MSFPANRNHFAPTGDNPAVFDFARTLWLAATANHDAMHNPDAAVTVPVPSDAEARQIGSMVIDYAANAFRLNVEWRGETLVWPNGATLAFSVTGRAKIRGEQPALIPQDEMRSLT